MNKYHVNYNSPYHPNITPFSDIPERLDKFENDLSNFSRKAEVVVRFLDKPVNTLIVTYDYTTDNYIGFERKVIIISDKKNYAHIVNFEQLFKMLMLKILPKIICRKQIKF